jgi:hypothetical protein
MDSVLRLEVAGFPAIETIILAILAQTDVVLAHAQAAIAFAMAFLFFPVAQQTDEFIRHRPRQDLS